MALTSSLSCLLGLQPDVPRGSTNSTGLRHPASKARVGPGFCVVKMPAQAQAVERKERIEIAGEEGEEIKTVTSFGDWDFLLTGGGDHGNHH